MSKKYEVGYGSPPEEHKWKPGQSGNPSGKSKKSPSKPVPDLLVGVFSDEIEVSIEGKKQKMSKGAALATSLIHNLLKANAKDQLKGIELLKKMGVFELQEFKVSQEQMEIESPITPAEKAMLQEARKLIGFGEEEKDLKKPVEPKSPPSDDDLDLDNGMIGS